MQAPNVDVKTGIHFGVLPQNALGEWAFEEFMNNGIDVAYESAITDVKEQVKKEIDDSWEDDTDNCKLAVELIIREYCGTHAAEEFADCMYDGEDIKTPEEAYAAAEEWLDDEFGQYWESAESDYLIVEYTDGEYWDGRTKYREEDVRFKASWSDTDVWVLKSGWVRVSAQCSPCAPNAGDLTAAAVSNSMGDAIPTYCLDPNDDTWWSEDNPCPYKDEAIPLEKYLKLAVETACERE